MANGILINLNRSLEITLRDNLDGLKEFTLMMASASVRPQFKILPVEHHSAPSSTLPSTPSLSPTLSLIETQASEVFPNIHHKKRA